ncbi:MAG: class I SAM-dependent rRNA methyltransferase [Elusimicrobia bacterium]|nr:class I SAM-dependent rRNA methyltransferase [Elusimicrobiota bacterium]
MTTETGKQELVTLTLKPNEEERLNRGHLWVFSNELAAVPKTVPPGSLAILTSSKGKMFGIGFYNPNSLIAFRLLAREPRPIDAAFFKDRLSAALARRRRWLGEARSFRLCFGESDGLPGLVIDKFEDCLVIEALSAGIERSLGPIVEALTELFKPAAIHARNEHPARVLEGLPSESVTLAGKLPERVVIEEDGLKFVVALGAGQKTGFYFDQRDNRKAVAALAKGRNVLDLYCYSGAFALHAARAGALRVVAVDSSGPALELARESAQLNALQGKVIFEEGDADGILEEFGTARRQLMPDLVLVDPPSLVPARKHLPKAIKAYVRLNSNAMRILSGGGIVVSSACSHHVSRETFVDILREAASRAQKAVRLVELRGAAKDHPVLLTMPETEYLNCAIMEID